MLLRLEFVACLPADLHSLYVLAYCPSACRAAPSVPSASKATAEETVEEVAPPGPRPPSRLEQAAAAAVAANAASTPRATAIELPIVTLDELEQAVGSARKQ